MLNRKENTGGMDEKVALEQIEKLEGKLRFEPENIPLITELLVLYNKTGKTARAHVAVETGLRTFQLNQLSSSAGVALVEACLEYWKGIKYTKKDSMRVNLSSDRSDVLSEIKDCLVILARMRDPKLQHRINFLLAYVKECMGSFQDALSLLSDLITIQASDGVELSFIILRAAVLLTHLSGYAQALEYLEYLVDDPPTEEGYKKTHILALLAMVYENSGEKYTVALQRTYDELQDAYLNDMATGRREQTNRRKIEKMLSEVPIKQNSALWEQLALQAIDRCEYVLAAEMLQQAMKKAPNKSRLLHLTAETYCILGETDRSAKCAERAFVLQPQSGDLRNLLLIVAPQKWREKLRTVPTTGQSMAAKEEGERLEKEQAKAQALIQQNESKLKRRSNEDDVGQEGGMFASFNKTVSGLQKTAMSKMAEIEKQRKERKEKEARKKIELAKENDRKKKMEEAAVRRPRNYIDRNEGPANPDMPEETDESRKVIDLIYDGNENIHLYDPVLIAYQNVKRELAMEEAKKNMKSAAADNAEMHGKKGKRKGKKRG